jgi:hypothetical protein
MVILFVDLLGVRDRWRHGGRAEAELAFVTLRTALVSALRGVHPERMLEGGIETDAVTLVFETPAEAVAVGRELYRIAFVGAKVIDDGRLWLRGVIVPFEIEEPLRSSRRLSPPYSEVKFYQYAGSLLEAIAVEKSGVKGMRLLIETSLVDKSLAKDFRIPVGALNLIPFRRLTHSPYPARVDNYRDVLWMASADQDEWTSRKQLMASRLRWSAANSEEFVQAAATQVVFHECNAIIQSLISRGKRPDA